MKLLYLHQYYNNLDMPGSTRSYYLSQKMSLQGHDVTVFTSYRGEERKKKFVTFDGNIKIIWVPVPYNNNLSFIQRKFAFIKFTIFATYHLIRNEYDLVYATSTPLTIGIPPLISNIIKKQKYIFEVRDLWPELPIAMGAVKNKYFIHLLKLLEKKIYQKASAIVALSIGMKKGIVDLGIKEEKVGVITNISDIDAFSPIATKKILNKSIIYAGALGHINNIEWICEFSKNIYKINKDIKVLVYGDGVKKTYLLNYIKDNKTNLKYCGKVNKKEVIKVFNDASLSIISFKDIEAMQNNSSNKFFDSLASATPVIINFGGWINDSINEASCGIDGWKRDCLDVANETNKIVMKNEKYIDMSQSALKLASTKFSRTIAERKITLILEEFAKNKKESYVKINHIHEDKLL